MCALDEGHISIHGRATYTSVFPFQSILGVTNTKSLGTESVSSSCLHVLYVIKIKVHISLLWIPSWSTIAHQEVCPSSYSLSSFFGFRSSDQICVSLSQDSLFNSQVSLSILICLLTLTSSINYCGLLFKFFVPLRLHCSYLWLYFFF